MDTDLGCSDGGAVRIVYGLFCLLGESGLLVLIVCVVTVVRVLGGGSCWSCGRCRKLFLLLDYSGCCWCWELYFEAVVSDSSDVAGADLGCLSES